MKRLFVLLFSLLLCNISYADIITINWINAEGIQHTQTTCESGDDVILPNNTPTKYGYEFIGWKLPAYIPIAYLENVASETYINTGFYTTEKSKIVIDFSVVSCTNSDTIPDVISSDLVGFFRRTTAFFRFGNQNNSFSSGIPTGRIKFTMSKDGYIVNSSKLYNYTYNPASSFICTTPLMIFAKDANNISNCITQLYSLQLYQNDILVHDYVPALDTNSVACLYDKVEDVFLYNSGTGNFTAGPIIDYD